MTNNNPFSKYFFLSGERLSTAKRVFRTDVLVGFIAGLVAAILTQLYPEVSRLLVFVILLGIIVWQLIRISRGETFFQLRLKENKASRLSADEALNELHTFAATLKGKSKG